MYDVIEVQEYSFLAEYKKTSGKYDISKYRITVENIIGNDSQGTGVSFHDAERVVQGIVAEAISQLVCNDNLLVSVKEL